MTKNLAKNFILVTGEGEEDADIFAENEAEDLCVDVGLDTNCTETTEVA